MPLFHVLRGLCLAVLSLAHPTARARLTISLVPADATLLPRTVHAVSDPTHPQYGAYLEREAALALLAPSPAALAAVTAWLRDAAGLQDHEVRRRGQFLHAPVSPRQSAALLPLRKRADGGQSGGAEVLAPPDVRRHIRAAYLDDEQGRHAPPQALLQRRRHANASAAPEARCEDKLTPACLRSTYRINNGPPRTSARTTLGIIGFSKQTAQYADLDLFLRDIDPARAGANFTSTFLNGGANPQGEYAAGEGNLDIQYALALAGSNVDVQFISVGGENSDFIPDLDLPSTGRTEPYLEFATALAALPSSALPSVISISYGVNEQLLARSYAEHVCDVFGQLAARGVSVIVAAGDAGPGQSCQANDGSHALRFLPAFPATCPYVTAVGATRYSPGGNEETAWELSGGGFSEYFARPAWQDAAVGGYLDRYGAQWEGLYNATGRGIPDVAALGRNYQIYNHGSVENADGTSAAAPVLAALIAVLNTLRAEKGKPAMGFLNPWLYKFGHYGLTDITTGKSTGCPGTSYSGASSPHIPDAGWPADWGWDAVTGLGTPVFARLRRLACL